MHIREDKAVSMETTSLNITMPFSEADVHRVEKLHNAIPCELDIKQD